MQLSCSCLWAGQSGQARYMADSPSACTPNQSRAHSRNTTEGAKPRRIPCGSFGFCLSVCQGFHWPVCDRTRKMPIKGLDIWGAVISYFQPCWLVQQQCVRLPGKTLAVVETKQKYCIWVRFGYLITCYFIFLFRYSSKRAYLLTTKTPVTIRSTVKIEIMSTSLVNVGQDAVKPKGVYQLQVINSVNLNILFKLPFYSTFIA